MESDLSFCSYLRDCFLGISSLDPHSWAPALSASPLDIPVMSLVPHPCIDLFTSWVTGHHLQAAVLTASVKVTSLLSPSQPPVSFPSRHLSVAEIIFFIMGWVSATTGWPEPSVALGPEGLPVECLLNASVRARGWESPPARDIPLSFLGILLWEGRLYRD